MRAEYKTSVLCASLSTYLYLGILNLKKKNSLNWENGVSSQEEMWEKFRLSRIFCLLPRVVFSFRIDRFSFSSWGKGFFFLFLQVVHYFDDFLVWKAKNIMALLRTPRRDKGMKKTVRHRSNIFTSNPSFFSSK